LLGLLQIYQTVNLLELLPLVRFIGKGGLSTRNEEKEKKNIKQKKNWCFTKFKFTLLKNNDLKVKLLIAFAFFQLMPNLIAWAFIN